MTLQCIAIFLYLIGHRFDVTDIKYAWLNSHYVVGGNFKFGLMTSHSYIPGMVWQLWSWELERWIK